MDLGRLTREQHPFESFAGFDRIQHMSQVELCFSFSQLSCLKQENAELSVHRGILWELCRKSLAFLYRLRISLLGQVALDCEQPKLSSELRVARLQLLCFHEPQL